MVTESNDPVCAALDCGDHGACRVVDDHAECACDEGFTGERCDECDGDLVLEGDACVAPCDAQDAPDCGEHGACEETDGAAACACEHPYVGGECGQCAQGFALQPDGTCEPDCGECGDHAFCNEELMTPSCECVAGYAMQGSSTCTWLGDGSTGGITDRDLDDPDAWTSEYVGFSAGKAAFENVTIEGVCKLASLEQTIRMPSYEDAEPFVLEMDVEVTCTYDDPTNCTAILVDLGDRSIRMPIVGGSTPSNPLTVCLTEADYRDELLLRVRPGFMQGNPMCGAPWPVIERIAIRPAKSGECPGRGRLLGNLSSPEDWLIHGAAAISGGKLSVPSGGASTLVHVPADGNLAFKYTTSTPGNTQVTLDGLPYFFGGTASNQTLCFPPWAHGGVHRVGFSRFLSGAEITQVSVEPSAACRRANFDASFDGELNQGSWMTALGNATATLAAGPDGRRAWRVQSTQTIITALVQVPGYGDDTVVPAMSITSRESMVSVAGTITINGAGLSSRQVMSSAWNAWENNMICLGSQWAGQPVSFAVGGVATSGSETPILWVDEIDFITVPKSACP